MSDITQNELVSMESWLVATRNSKGYESEDLVKDLLENFKKSIPLRVEDSGEDPIHLSVRRAHLLAAWNYALARTTSRELIVCDVGGGNGYMYDWIAKDQNFDFKSGKHLQLNIGIKWQVLESASISTAYNANKESLPIEFLENKQINYPPKIDFTIMSCYIQYVDNWKEILHSISTKSEFVLLMRVPVIPSNFDKVYVQHVYSEIYGKSDACWPIRFFSESHLENHFHKNFSVIYSGCDFEETIPFKGKKFPLRTYLLKRKDIQSL